ncbi:J domain-containing protein [uncultured Ruminococcus sp.]|uniref:J domain-containing protein n=1 Tax=uncultured Ruminococcus sp. TaxID=165186 RepID=UPI00263679FD|nr:J domain-containing protein [uncultured Ruminococcus sp.]
MDPYEVLGISRNATDQEVKKAYRALSRKYHPDANVGKPDAKAYEEKFKQIQQAYQTIMDERQNSGANRSYSSFQGHSRSAAGSGDENSIHMQAAVNFIRNGRFSEAVRVLEGMKKRNANWYYTAAVAHSGAGNNATAVQYARTAAQMEPNNYEYQRLVQQLESPGFSYQQMQQPYMSSGGWDDSGCLRCCAANLLLNVLLNCCCHC